MDIAWAWAWRKREWDVKCGKGGEPSFGHVYRRVRGSVGRRDSGPALMTGVVGARSSDGCRCEHVRARKGEWAWYGLGGGNSPWPQPTRGAGERPGMGACEGNMRAGWVNVGARTERAAKHKGNRP